MKLLLITKNDEILILNIINEVEGYKISNCGILKNHKGQISVGSNQEGGYLLVSILSKYYYLHILVSKVFIPNPENKKQVNHIDGNKLNSKFRMVYFFRKLTTRT